MSERTDSSNLRIESRERLMPTEYLLDKWPEVYEEKRALLGVAFTEDNFVDIVRTASLRAGIAGQRDLEQWKYKWYDLKYEALIKAARYKKDEGLDLEISFHNNLEDETRLSFSFGTTPKRYRTVASIGAMLAILGEVEYQNLFGETAGPEKSQAIRE